MTKICTKCKRELDVSDFYKNKNKKDGLDSWCKFCTSDNRRKYYQNEEHRQHKRDWDLNYYQRTKNTKHRKNYEQNYRKSNQLNINHQINIMYNLKQVTGKTLEKSWETLVPYTLQDLRVHLEAQFTPFMSWDNYGTNWEIDHIIPKVLFQFKSAEDKEFQICWSLMNLRPLSVSENRSRPKDGSDISEGLRNTILNQDLN